MATETELRRAEAATWGGKPVRQAKLRKWTAYRNPAGTMLGFLSVELASGIIVNDLKLMVGPKGSRWIAMPAKQRDRGDATGKAVWDDYLEFRDKATREKFQDQILAVLRREHPEAFADEGER